MNYGITQNKSNSNRTADTPPRLRLPLSTAQDVVRELARLYRDGKSGQRDIQDVSRLANVLQILNRCIEGSTFEQRLEKLEGLKNGND